MANNPYKEITISSEKVETTEKPLLYYTLASPTNCGLFLLINHLLNTRSKKRFFLAENLLKISLKECVHVMPKACDDVTSFVAELIEKAQIIARQDQDKNSNKEIIDNARKLIDSIEISNDGATSCKNTLEKAWKSFCIQFFKEKIDQLKV